MSPARPGVDPGADPHLATEAAPDIPPLHGWRRWAVIAGQGLAGFVVLFALVMALFGFAFLRRHPSGNSDRPVGQAFVLWGGPLVPVLAVGSMAAITFSLWHGLSGGVSGVLRLVALTCVGAAVVGTLAGERSRRGAL
mgnify:CR=1 FL=1